MTHPFALKTPTSLIRGFHNKAIQGALISCLAQIGAVLCLSFCATSIAQTQPSTNEENWYQVELLIFKRATSTSAYNKELWPKNIALAYPPNIRHLISDEAPANTAETAGTETIATLDEAELNHEAATPLMMTSAESDNSPAYRLLTKQAFLIPNAASAIKRESGTHILFHESWAQPMLPQEHAPALVIRGGNMFGENFELEGSVTLSLSRYLHINTDLWLSEFVANYGQEDFHWPSLPGIPRPVDISLLSTDTNQEGLEPITGLAADLGTNQQWSPSLSAQGKPQPHFNNSGKFSNKSDALMDDYARLAERPFLIKDIATLTQKRRMRSNELHYIDHPKMGILIKIAPYTPDDTDLERSQNN